MKIIHPEMEPYFIEIEDARNYTLKRKTLNTKKEPIEVVEGYFSSVEGCLRKIVRAKTLEGEDTITLDTYIVKIESLMSKIQYNGKL